MLDSSVITIAHLRRACLIGYRHRLCLRVMIWWALQDLNLQPTDYESAALTIELRAQTVYLLYFIALTRVLKIPIVTIFVTIERPCHRFLKRKQGRAATFRNHSLRGGGHSLKYTVQTSGRAGWVRDIVGTKGRFPFFANPNLA